MQVTINGTPYDMEAGVLTYERIARLARIPAEYVPSMTYRVRETGASGILIPGDRIYVSDGLVLTCVRTGGA